MRHFLVRIITNNQHHMLSNNTVYEIDSAFMYKTKRQIEGG